MLLLGLRRLLVTAAVEVWVRRATATPLFHQLCASWIAHITSLLLRLLLRWSSARVLPGLLVR